MDSSIFLRNAITSLKGIKFKTLAELAEKAQVNQGNLSAFMKPEDDPKRRETMTFDTAWKILGVLGMQPSTMQRPGPNAPVEIVAGDDEDLASIPVLGSAGAGDAVEFFKLAPERFIQVLKQYAAPGVVALRVEGDSMEPTIHKGSYVGVAPLDGSRIVDGNIYLVNLPYLGRVVKRIRMRGDGTLEMYSDNPKFAPQALRDEGFENIIVGRVVWIWQMC